MNKPMDSKPSVCFGVDWESAIPDDMVRIPYAVADAGGTLHIVRDAGGNTPLHFAAAYSQKAGVVEALVRAGAKPERNNEWETPIMLALRHHNAEAIRPLTEAGDELSFFWVAKNVQSSKMAYTIANQTNVDWDKKNSHGHTPLQSAVAAGNVAVINGFIKGRGDDLSRRRELILHFAIESGASREIVRMLIEGGADINARNEEWLSPLDYAFENGNKEMVEELTKAGGAGSISGIAFGIDWKNATVADVAGINQNSYSPPFGLPISWAASLCPDPGVIDALVESGVNLSLPPDSYDGNGNHLFGFNSKHPVNLAAANNADVLPALIKAGADIGIGDNYRWMPLHFAALNNNCRSVVILIQARADVNAENGNGETPLYVALRDGQMSMDVITTLIGAGANVNAVTWRRKTALDLVDEVLDMEKNSDGRNSPENMEIKKILVDAGGIHFADL